ncbi:MAG: FtsQ-type POTRA domain-containing protein [Dehalococcoidia bacterium]|nr:MAG: FtsQ-type POTRA domain-containing protein [Dehalococcoidia bacterium]
MPGARTPGKWPYRAAKPVRGRRVVKARDASPRGVHRRTAAEPTYRITRLQARLVLAAAVLAMLGSGAWWAYHSPWVTVEHAQVRGLQQLSPEQIRSAAGVDGKSVFGLDLKAAQARVAALPMVKSATVTKHGWNGVTIDVQERTVWGSWQMNGANVPIDADGYVLDGPPALPGSPVIVEANPHRVLNAGDRLDPGAIELAARLVRESDAAFGRTVQALVYQQDAGIIAVLSGSATDDRQLWVTFGDARDYDYKVAALYVLIQQAQDENLTLNTVDLRFGDRLSFN